MNTSCRVSHQLGLGEVQRIALGQRRQQFALVGKVVEQHDLAVAARCLELGALLGVVQRDASATLVALPAPPATLIRPWIRVPSMVKNRLVWFSIGVV